MSTENKTPDNDDTQYGPGVGSTATDLTGAVKRDTVLSDDKAPNTPPTPEEKANITAAKQAISPNNDTTTSGSRKS